MSLTLLLDLDDTLLDTNLEAFMPAYFQAFSQHLAQHSAPSTLLRALIEGVNLMNESEDPTRTLEEIFDAYQISEEQARKDKPDYFLILPWHFLPAFRAREHEYFAAGGHFLVPLPRVAII